MSTETYDYLGKLIRDCTWRETISQWS